MTASTPVPRSAGAPRLVRSRKDRVLAGVCGGLAEAYGADPTVIRLGTAVLAILTGIVPLLAIYIVASIVIPEADASGEASAAGRVRSGDAALLIGAILVTIGLAALADQVFAIDWELVWPFALVVIGGVLVFRTARPAS